MHWANNGRRTLAAFVSSQQGRSGQHRERLPSLLAKCTVPTACPRPLAHTRGTRPLSGALHTSLRGSQESRTPKLPAQVSANLRAAAVSGPWAAPGRTRSAQSPQQFLGNLCAHADGPGWQREGWFRLSGGAGKAFFGPRLEPLWRPRHTQLTGRGAPRCCRPTMVRRQAPAAIWWAAVLAAAMLVAVAAASRPARQAEARSAWSLAVSVQHCEAGPCWQGVHMLHLAPASSCRRRRRPLVYSTPARLLCRNSNRSVETDSQHAACARLACAAA